MERSDSQDSIARSVIERSMRKGRLAHSILLFGRSQEALEALSFEVAALLLDFKPRKEGEVITNWPDFLALRPAKKARQISADDTRELIRRIQHSPQVGNRKVAVIFEADRLNASSANIFLKTLEEPPLDTTILLLTTRPYSLLPTIRSRCLHLRVTETLGSGEDTDTRAWLDAYRTWLDRLVDDTPTKDQVPELILGLYALVSDFRDHLEKVTKEAVKAHGTDTENLTGEERDALEAGIAIGIRDRILALIEETTSGFARELARQGRTTLATRLPAAIASLEEVARLLRIFYAAPNAIEQFLITSLRLWSAPE